MKLLRLVTKERSEDWPEGEAWKVLHGISTDISPATHVTGHQTPNYNLMRLEFGTYVKVFEDNTPSNTPRACPLEQLHSTQLVMHMVITI